MQALFNSLSAGGYQLALLVISMIPFVELRGAVPLGIGVGLPWWETYLICVIGNILPIPFIILFGRHVFNWLRKTKLFAPIYHRFEARLLSKSQTIIKYSFWGLVLFVAIPIPGTGAWSGAAISVLLDLRLRISLPAILLGILLAGGIMALLSMGVFGALNAVT